MAPSKLMVPKMMITSRQSSDKSKKRTSLTKLDLSIETLFGHTQMLMIPTTTVETKNAPPRMLLRPTSLVFSPMKETMLANKSGAPFPRERRVAPAMVGESFKVFDRPSREEQK